MTVTHESVVIGGGPAGSATAILLAREGRDVLVLEKSRSAHDKVCGEFISWEAVHYLERLGVDLPGMGARPINRLRLIDRESVFETVLPFTAWSLSRRLLDETLLSLAAQAGAGINRGTAVRTLTRTDNHWTISTSQTSFLSQTVFLASGKHDLHGWSRKHDGINDSIGFKLHLRLSAENTVKRKDVVEVYLFDGGYAGLEPIENDQYNLCLLIKKDIYTTLCKHDLTSLLDWLGRQSPHMACALVNASAVWKAPLAVYAVPYGFLFRSGENHKRLFRLGDQMAVIPSFAGDGMAIALHSAHLAASIFLSDRDAADYHASAWHSFRPPVRLAGWINSATACATGRRLLFFLARVWPGFITSSIQGTRLARSSILPEIR